MANTERGARGRFVKTIADEPKDSTILPADAVEVLQPERTVDVLPAHLQMALDSELAEPRPVGLMRGGIDDWPMREQKYYRAVADVIAEKGWPTNGMIAHKMGVNESSLARWRHRHPELDIKVSQVLERQVDQLWGRVLHRAFVLAVKGSIDHMTFLAKVTRRLAPENEGPSGVNVQVNIRV